MAAYARCKERQILGKFCFSFRDANVISIGATELGLARLRAYRAKTRFHVIK